MAVGGVIAAVTVTGVADTDSAAVTAERARVTDSGVVMVAAMSAATQAVMSVASQVVTSVGVVASTAVVVDSTVAADTAKIAVA
jgi:hypothetical protein